MSSLRNFGIAFVVSLLILSLCAYFAVGFVEKRFSAESGASKKNGSISQKFDDNAGQKKEEVIRTGRSFNAVIVGTDYDPQSFTDYKAPAVDDGKLHVLRRVNATAILFVRFDKEARAIRVASIPVQTAVSVDFVQMTLGQSYGFKGGQFIKEQVGSLLGMTVDYLFEFSGREFANFVKTRLMTHDYTVPITVTTTTEKRIPAMSFSKDQVIRTENALFTLLHHTNYDMAHLVDRHSLLTSIFLQTLSKMTVTNDPTEYYEMLKPLNTDMTQNDVKDQMEVLFTLPLFIGASESPTTVSIIELYKLGAYQGEFFKADEAAVKAAFVF